MTMPTVDNTENTHKILRKHDISQEILDRIVATSDTAPDSKGDMRKTLKMGYTVNKDGFDRYKSVVEMNSTAENMVDQLNSKSKMATFIDIGMRRTPLLKRIKLPDWIIQLSNADQSEKSLLRANKIANEAITKE